MSRELDQAFVFIQHLENVIAQQARQIEVLNSRGLFGLAQRRRMRSESKFLNRYLKEDELRQNNLRLKRKVKMLQERLNGHSE
jgi:hypothetical protein